MIDFYEPILPYVVENDTSVPGEVVSGTSVQRRTELFNLYVLPYKNLVYKLCLMYSQSPADVEDNYSEALLNFFRYIETYDPERPIQTWLHIVTKRLILEITKRKNLMKRSDEVDMGNIADPAIECEASANCLGMDNYELYYNDDILEALSQLRPIYREALLLQQAGYKLNEIMEISYRNGNLKSKNIETVKSRLFLAKQQMKKLITRDGKRRKE